MVATLISGPFVFFGVLGVAWAAVWAFTATTFPAQSSKVNAEELRRIEDGGSVVAEAAKAGGKKAEGVPFKLLLSKAPVWVGLSLHSRVSDWFHG
jgi:hypothetical protein